MYFCRTFVWVVRSVDGNPSTQGHESNISFDYNSYFDFYFIFTNLTFNCISYFNYFDFYSTFSSFYYFKRVFETLIIYLFIGFDFESKILILLSVNLSQTWSAVQRTTRITTEKGLKPFEFESDSKSTNERTSRKNIRTVEYVLQCLEDNSRLLALKEKSRLSDLKEESRISTLEEKESQNSDERDLKM